MTKQYYATQSPRGFANEVDLHIFPTRTARDEWVEDHFHDGDVNAATRGARAITAREAQHHLREAGLAYPPRRDRQLEAIGAGPTWH